MNCKNCGAALFETSKFCPECGTPVEAAAEASAEEKKTETAAPVQEPEAEIKTAAEPIKTEEEPKPAVMDAEEIIKEVIAASEHPAEAPALPTEEEIKENLEAVESITEDLPEIAVIEHVEDIPVTADVKETLKPSKPEPSHEETAAPQQDEATPRKSNKPIIAAVVFIVIALILAAAAYFLSQNSPENTHAAETTVTELYTEDSAVSDESMTEVSLTETEPSAAEETSVNETETPETEVSEIETPETEMPETEMSEETSAEISETEAQSGEIVILPETHDFAMGSSISAEISLAEAGALESLSDTTLLAAYYNIRTEHVGPTPIIAIIKVGSDEIEVEPASSADDMAVFEYSSMIGAVASMGHFPNEIDVIAFRSNGAPIDVYSVSVINE